MALGEEVAGPLKEKLIMNYPDEIKRLIVESHSVYSAAALNRKKELNSHG